MGKKSIAFDQYILKSASFAQPILHHIRELVHMACPETEEKIKWGMPFFDYKNDNLCFMASFKQHCGFGFWKTPLIKGLPERNNPEEKSSMGNLGKLMLLKDLPSDKKIIGWIKQAMVLNEKGIKVAKKEKDTVVKKIEMPDDFLKALKKNKTAFENFHAFTFSQKKDYIQWITEAKTEATRDKRMITSIEWIAEKKVRNWKYEKPKIK